MKRREKLIEFSEYFRDVDSDAVCRLATALEDLAEELSGNELTEFFMAWQRATTAVQFPKYL